MFVTLLFNSVDVEIAVLFSFPDLSTDDKSQSPDTVDGQSWPKGAGNTAHWVQI